MSDASSSLARELFNPLRHRPALKDIVRCEFQQLRSRLAAELRLKFFGLEAVEAGDVPSRSSIGTENPIPEEMDHREIAVRVPVMNEVQLLFPSEPRKPLKSRSLHVVFLVKKDVRVERRRTSKYLNHEEIERQ
jgi:hypothetical protein